MMREFNSEYQYMKDEFYSFFLFKKETKMNCNKKSSKLDITNKVSDYQRLIQCFYWIH